MKVIVGIDIVVMVVFVIFFKFDVFKFDLVKFDVDVV